MKMLIAIACATAGATVLACGAALAADAPVRVTTINGKPLPARVLPLRDARVMLDTTDAGGKRLLIVQGTRLAGTRAPIHTHRSGGHTCV